MARPLDTPWRRPGWLRYAIAWLRTAASPPVTVTDPPADIVVEHDLEVTTRDGTVSRVNVLRPRGETPRSVLLSAHPYGKDNVPKWRRRKWTFSPQYHALRQPTALRFSALTSWEAPDPAWWVAQGFAVVNADLRGCGTSEGTGALLSHQEAEDTYDIVDWAAAQPWSDGRVVMSGVSYLAITQHAVAALRPAALKAIIPWEGFSDVYRDLAVPGGVREKGFLRMWAAGVRRTTRQSYDMIAMGDTHPLRDEFWQSLVPDVSAIHGADAGMRQLLRPQPALARVDTCVPADEFTVRAPLHPPRGQVGDLLLSGCAGRPTGVRPHRAGRHRVAKPLAHSAIGDPRRSGDHRGGARAVRLAAGAHRLASALPCRPRRSAPGSSYRSSSPGGG